MIGIAEVWKGKVEVYAGKSVYPFGVISESTKENPLPNRSLCSQSGRA